MVVLEEVVRVAKTGCPSGTRSYEGWEPLRYTRLHCTCRRSNGHNTAENIL